MNGQEYVNSVLETVNAKSAGESEFLSAVTEVTNSLIPVFDMHPEYIKGGLLERLVEPERQIMLEFHGLMIMEMYK